MKKISAEKKEQVVLWFKKGEASAVEIGQYLGVNRNLIYRWVQAYDQNGIEGLRPNHRKRYIDKNPIYCSGRVKRSSLESERKGQM